MFRKIPQTTAGINAAFAAVPPRCLPACAPEISECLTFTDRGPEKALFEPISGADKKVSVLGGESKFPRKPTIQLYYFHTNRFGRDFAQK
jgi:hypothetical protein